MTKVKLLVQGYARSERNVELASCAVTLIKDNNLNILVDPGMNRKLLLSSLKKEGLSVKDINYVVLTHTHIDHCSLVGIFDNAKILDDSSIYTFDGKITNHSGKIPGTNIEIIKTPGHDQFHCSLLVHDDNLGKVIIASDVFWWYDNEKQVTDRNSLLNHKDPYVKSESQLKESRINLLSLADYIIPGHGKMFKVNKE